MAVGTVKGNGDDGGAGDGADAESEIYSTVCSLHTTLAGPCCDKRTCPCSDKLRMPSLNGSRIPCGHRCRQHKTPNP